MSFSGVLVWPAYRCGYYITKDDKTRWPGSFDWLVKCPKGFRMGWFGSLESAYVWVYKQVENGIMKGYNDGW